MITLQHTAAFGQEVFKTNLAGFTGTERAMLKFAGYLALGAAAIAAPFMIHAYATCKPGTVYAQAPRCRNRR